MLAGLGAGTGGLQQQQAAATPPPVTPAPTLAALGVTPPPVTPAPTAAANSLTSGTSAGLGGKPAAGFGGFGDAATPAPVAAATPAPTAPTLSTPAPTPPVALSTALGGGGQQSASNALQSGLGAQQPKGISSGGGSLGSASASTPPQNMIWNGKMPGASADNSANGQWWCAPELVLEVSTVRCHACCGTG